MRKIIQPDDQLCPRTCFFVFTCSHQNIHLSIPFRIRKKDWAKWNKWARILKNTLTEEHLCSLTCFFVSACFNMYQNINSFIAFEIRKKDWAKWAKWARILKNTLTEEHSCSLTCFFISAGFYIYQILIHLSKFKLENKIEQNELSELECSKTPLQMSSYAH